MARVTVEDCIEIIPNRFELVTIAAQRARQISSGNPLTLPRDNDKDSVVALREIAEKTVSVDALKEEVILSHQKHGKADVIDDGEGNVGSGSIENNMGAEAASEIAGLQTAAEGEVDLTAEPSDALEADEGDDVLDAEE